MNGTAIRTLFVLRHAHASSALPGQRDHLRPLDERGRLETATVARTLVELADPLERVVCSTATRARETLAIAMRALPGVRTDFSDDLYALGVSAYLQAARSCAGVRTALIVGHNPMIAEFVASLLRGGEPDAVRRLEQGFPTAGLAVVDFETAFERIEPGAGTLRHLADPRRTGGA